MNSPAGARVLADETIGVPFQEAIQFRFQLVNLFSVPAWSSLMPVGQDSFSVSPEPDQVDIAL